MKKLVIAEKPSVAADLSKAIGKLKKYDDRYEGDDYVVSWAVGHLVELFMPEDIDQKFKKWSFTTLPIIPKTFGTKPIEKTKKRFQELKQLIQRADVDMLINGCDAGREGELIFTYIYELTKCDKPFKRLWLSSMTMQGIRDSFDHLRDSNEMQDLQDAAKCRSEADWLIGINSTRAVTSKMFRTVAKHATTVGRVQTPTLAMIVARDSEISHFTPQKYWRVTCEFGISSGQYTGMFQKQQKLDSKNEHDRIDRLWTENEAEAVLSEVSNTSSGIVKEKTKRSRQTSPRLYDLTTLQREANTKHGMSANMTLNIAQALYEKHKCITYPRTDSRALTEDYVDTCYKILGAVNGENKQFAQKVIESHMIDGGNKKIFNNKQVSDHFAIIPTLQFPKSLKDDEQKIFNMILKRFICVFFPDAEFDITTRITQVAGHEFKTEGKVLTKPGWMEVYGKSGSEQSGTLPAVTENDGMPPVAHVIDAEKNDEETRPPAPYNEATLLAAMEGAGKLLEDEDLVDAMKERGLGTPATRAQIIEHLISTSYIIRDKKEIKSTPKAADLLNFLKAAKIETLANPAMTGEWEYKLRLMENGEFKRQDFMNEISGLTAAIVEKTKNFVETGTPTNIKYPLDGTPVMETMREYVSSDKKFSIKKVIGNRRISEDEVAKLLSSKRVGPLSGFTSKSGSPFSATLVLGDDMKVTMEFDTNNSEIEPSKKLSKEELDRLEVIGKCPICQSDIVVTDSAYACKIFFEKKCKLRVAKKMLGQDIKRENIEQMLTNGKTDVIEKFRSKRTNKLFSARLALQKDGRIRFEFEKKAATAKQE